MAAPMAVLLAASLAAPAAAQSPDASAAAGGGVTQVVTGLDSPRGIAIGADGTLYVAEVGTGGTEDCITDPESGRTCFGDTGGISTVVDGTATRLVDGVISAISDTGETLGISDVAVGGDGTVWLLVGGPGPGAAEARAGITGGEGIGQLYRVSPDGSLTSVADLVQYESDNNPDAAQPGNELPDSNAYGLALTDDGGALIADAGGNDLLQVAPDGTISTVAVFPVHMLPVTPELAAMLAGPAPSMEAGASPAAAPASAPAMPSEIPMDPVPTAVTIGPDGAYYVGELTGFPFPPGGASVFRVVPGEEPTTYASGFTNIIDLAFGPDDSLYVLGITHDGLLSAFSAGPGAPPPSGGLWKVPPGGGTPEDITPEGLIMPGGLAIADDGTVYATTCAICPEMGGVVSLVP
jgi:sugar lactone lactonase YvrE